MIFVISFFAALTAYVEGCTQLSASTTLQTFDSHPNHGTSDYPNSYSACWVITAPSGYVVRLYTAYGFDLEYCSLCSCDSLEISCGSDGSDGDIGTYCGSTGRRSSIYSSGQEVYVEFSTDSANSGDGFTLYYAASSVDTGGECGYTYSYDSDSYERSSNAGGSGGGGAIAAAIIIPLVIIGALILCCYCCYRKCCKKETRVEPETQVFYVRHTVYY